MKLSMALGFPPDAKLAEHKTLTKAVLFGTYSLGYKRIAVDKSYLYILKFWISETISSTECIL